VGSLSANPKPIVEASILPVRSFALTVVRIEISGYLLATCRLNRKERGQYYVSFCYENGKDESELSSNAEHLAFLQGSTKEYLEDNTIGIDRGVKIPVHARFQTFDFSDRQKKNMTKADRYIKRLQRKLARQQKGSRRRNKTKYRISSQHAKKADMFRIKPSKRLD